MLTEAALGGDRKVIAGDRKVIDGDIYIGSQRRELMAKPYHKDERQVATHAEGIMV